MSDAEAHEPSSRRFELPPVREFNDRATLWLLEDPRNLGDLMRIHSPQLVEHLDFTQAERINRSFIPADLQKQESGLLFRVPFVPESDEEGAGRVVWVYLLLEHQSRPDPLMALRLLSYMLELWNLQRREWEQNQTSVSERRLTPVVPFVFYTGEENWNYTLRFPDMFDTPPGFERFLPVWDMLFLNLRQTSPETLTAFASAIGWAFRALQAEKAPLVEIEAALHEAMAGLNELSEEQRGQWSRIAWYFLLLVTHRRSPEETPGLVDLLRTEARQSKFWESEEWTGMEITYADFLRNQGREEGREEGAQTSLRAALENILTSKFGALSEPIQQAIAAASLDTMNDWLLKAAMVDSLEAVGILPANE